MAVHLEQKKLSIVAHFASCNLGDRNQGKIIADHLTPTAVDLTYINFADFPSEDFEIIETCKGRSIKVVSPKTVTDRDIETCDNLWVLSGSFRNDCYWVPLIKRYLCGSSAKILIWGGFSGVDSIQSKKDLEWMSDEKITFLGRGGDDIDRFNQCVSHLRPPLDYRSIGGDPIYSYFMLDNPLLEMNPMYKTFIGSVYFYNHNPIYFDILVDTADTIIFIDTHADGEIYEKVKYDHPTKRVVLTNDIEVLVRELSQSKIVVSNRLHGGMIAFGMDIPTIFVCPDDAQRYTKSFKYHNIALSGLGDDSKPLCKVADVSTQTDKIWEIISEKEKEDYKMNNVEYRDLVAKTITQLKEWIYT